MVKDVNIYCKCGYYWEYVSFQIQEFTLCNRCSCRICFHFRYRSFKMGKLARKRKKDWNPIKIPTVIQSGEDPGTETIEYQESYR